MKIAMGSDHGGFALKQHLKTYLENKGCLVEDCGTDSTQSCDYPDFGRLAAEAGVSGASSSAPPVSASPFPPTRSAASAARCAPNRSPPR